MTERGLLSDESARIAVREKLDTTMLVQAGAGSGKTTLMVDRLIAYVARGTPLDQIAAVTFTRKAANELRQRLENGLETEARTGKRSAKECAHLQDALQNRERMFIGTIHAFCGRILREHALDAGLPPDFVELDELESKALRAHSWQNYLENTLRNQSRLLREVAAIGIDATSLAAAFAMREMHRDVNFPALSQPRPTHERTRDALLNLMENSSALLASAGITEMRDPLQKTLNRLWRRYRTHEHWKSDAQFALDVATLLTKSQREITQKHWAGTPPAKKVAKQFKDAVDDFVERTLTPWFESWWAFTYPFVMALFNEASAQGLVERRRRGQLGFDDLLTETARLLRTNAMARNAIGTRWRYLLVDEFQDTDPIQAEICLLLASEPSEGNDWVRVTVRPGSLFVVGDPKQSIYRFRRADLATFTLVEQRIANNGEVVSLNNNFRSVPAIGTLVNLHFRNVFHSPENPLGGSAHQAPFAEFVAATTPAPNSSSGVWHYEIGAQGKVSNPQLVAEDARRVASWIEMRCNERRDRKPGDFLILTFNKGHLSAYARQLAMRNIPTDVSGAASESDDVLDELLAVLRAIADPGNSVAVIAALEGWCFGCSHQDLWDAREMKMEFRVTLAPLNSATAVGAGLQQLHDWWTRSQQSSAASLVEHILDESGLLVLAASEDLGDRSAGQLLQLVSMLRRGNVGTDLASAIAAIEAALDEDTEGASLHAGQTNAVRVMNLHKAKGLEAPVVILAAPIPPREFDPSVALWRDERGNAEGALLVRDADGKIVARAADWSARAAAEEERENEEHGRLLYVAVTRAKDELIVSRRAKYALANKETRTDESRWSPLARVLDEHAERIEVLETDPPGRLVMQDSAQQIAERIAASEQMRANSLQSHYRIASVTEDAKRNASAAVEDGASFAAELKESNAAVANGVQIAVQDDPRGFGSLVHLALEGVLRGRNDLQLERYVRAQTWLALKDADVDAVEAMSGRVLSTVAQAMATNEWRLLASAGSFPLAELNVSHVKTNQGVRTLAEGIIDVASFNEGRWTVVDWKNSSGSDAGWQELIASYQSQAEAYADALTARTGAPGDARIVRLRGNVGQIGDR